MAEIKSAVELAMEKTRGLVMDGKEKASQARKELAVAVRAIFRRYREGLIDEDGVGGELGKLGGDDTQVREVGLDIVMNEFDHAEDPSATLPILRFACFAVEERRQGELQDIEKGYVRDLENISAAVRAQVIDELGRIGILGSAVEVNIKAWPQWLEASNEARRSLREQIVSWKKKFLEQRS